MTGKPSADEPLPAPSGRRAVPEVDWRDLMLDLAVTLPIDRGDPPIVEAVVEILQRLLPGYCVGACIGDAMTGEQIIAKRVPPGTSGDVGRDPTRLFPALAHERVVRVGVDADGSTLHVAGNDPGIDDSASATAELADRGAEVLGSALGRARLLRRAQDAGLELRQLQAQMIQAEKLASLGQIVAGVVHELNNPLTSIVAYSDFLGKRAREREDAEDAERLRRIDEAAQRILKFSRDLVAYARPTSEIPAPVSLSEVIDKALVFCEHEFSESGVNIIRNSTDDLPPVRGIAGQLVQVFVNLFTNAAHAMSGRNGELVVQTALVPGGGAALIEVADRGTGIDADQLEQIFEPFFTTKTEGRGTGLGLSIVRNIVTSHGGTLLARSTPGHGTVFSITLPLSNRPPSTRPGNP